jgi:YVTN family beta-propeller protein
MKAIIWSSHHSHRKRRSCFERVASSLLLFVTPLVIGAEEPVTLKVIKTIPLPGVRGRFDHFAMDTKGQRLFVAALGNNTLEVVDTGTGKRLKSITGLRSPTGVVYLEESNQIGVANGGDGAFKVFDGNSYDLVKTVSSLADADNVRYDAKTRRIYVGYAAGALAVIDSATMKQTGSIKLAAHPESFQLEKNGHRIFVNVPDAKHVAVIDREREQVIATWRMTDFKANFPMALDEGSHRLFVGCRHPARLVVFDTGTGESVANSAVSGDTDDLFYDAKRKRLYISCGEGSLDVITQGNSDAYDRRAMNPTRGGARTSFFSPELDELYIAVPLRGQQNAELRIFRAD